MSVTRQRSGFGSAAHWLHAPGVTFAQRLLPAGEREVQAQFDAGSGALAYFPALTATENSAVPKNINSSPQKVPKCTANRWLARWCTDVTRR